MELSPKNRMEFIDQVMTRCGYVPVQSRQTYARPKKDDEDEDQENSRWGFGGSQRNSGGQRKSGGQRNSGSQRKPPRRKDDDDLF
jgi:hypothetical protein